MKLLMNDLSIHEQFHDIEIFYNSLERLMTMRNAAKEFGLKMLCHRGILNSFPINGISMQRAIGQLSDKNKQRAIMTWLTKDGPFWNDIDIRQHSDNHYLEHNDDVVTDTAVGEAAFLALQGIPCGITSITPSDWNFSPVSVTWYREDEGLHNRTIELENWWNIDALKKDLSNAAPPIKSWKDLREASRRQCNELRFAENCFDPLEEVPFITSGAQRFLYLLSILNQLACAFETTGERTSEGHRIHKDCFEGGKKALFSDSSSSEKDKFRRELTFSHPDELESDLFCPWHGKVRSQNLRLHFSWPIKSGEPVYVVYAGPKLTKR